MNSKDKNYKELLRNRRRYDEIREAQRNLGYEKLEKPYQKGWDGYWVLRDDIAKSEEGQKLQVLIENFGTTIFSDNKEFKSWSRQERKYVYNKPGFKLVPESEWENFYAWAQKWFVHVPSEDRHSWWYPNGVKRYYKCIIPDWMLVMKKEKHWVTHYKVVDEVLEQELSELEAEYDTLTDHRGWYKMGHKSAKPYKKFRHKEFRNKVKREVRKVIRTKQWDEMDLPIVKRCILWDMY